MSDSLKIKIEAKVNQKKAVLHELVLPPAQAFSLSIDGAYFFQECEKKQNKLDIMLYLVFILELVRNLILFHNFS